MSKKLPKMFTNTLTKSLGNNEKVYYSKYEDELKKDTTKKTINKTVSNNSANKDIDKKIDDIFNSSRFIYKADVEIITKSGKAIKRIIGRNQTNLITMESELIPITEIEDIKFSN